MPMTTRPVSWLVPRASELTSDVTQRHTLPAGRATLSVWSRVPGSRALTGARQLARRQPVQCFLFFRRWYSMNFIQKHLHPQFFHRMFSDVQLLFNFNLLELCPSRCLLVTKLKTLDKMHKTQPAASSKSRCKPGTFSRSTHPWGQSSEENFPEPGACAVCCTRDLGIQDTRPGRGNGENSEAVSHSGW